MAWPTWIPAWLRRAPEPVFVPDPDDPRAVLRDELRGHLQNANVRAFLRVIRAGESDQTDGAYSMLFGGDHFNGFAAHPNIKVKKSGYVSTAAGAYQFLSRTWTALRVRYGFHDFGPECQDMGAVALLRGRNALDDVAAGRIQDALPKAGLEWASMPGSPYGQPTMTVQGARKVYAAYGGTEA